MRKYVVFWLIIIFVLGGRLVFYFLQEARLQDGQLMQGVGIVQSQPKISGHKQSFSLKIQDYVIYITTVSKEKLWYGEAVNIAGKIRINNTTKNSYLTIPQASVSVNDQQSVLSTLTNSLRKHVYKIYLVILPADYAALLMGIVFGVQQPMSNNFLTDLKNAGVMHVIAASGMNITLIGGMVMSLSRKYFQRHLAIILSLLVIFFYTALAGFQSSIVRAAIMGALAFSANLTGRQKQSIYILLLTAVGMLVFNPGWLVDIGFQLSFGATAGILLIKPLIDQLTHKWSQGGLSIIDDVSTTVVAQIATTPILLSNFGYFNPLSVVINAFVLWTVPPLMLLGGVGAFVSYIWADLAEVFIYLSYPILWYFVSIISISTNFDTVFVVQNITGVFNLGYYLLLGGILLIVTKKRSQPKAYSKLKHLH